MQNYFDLSALIGPEKLKQLLHSIHAFTGFAVGCMDADGNLLYKAGSTESFCMDLVRKSSLGLERCNQFASTYTKQSGKNSSNVYECHAGLLDGRIPIVAEGNPIGFLVTGQVIETLPEEEEAKRYAQELGIDSELYWKKLQKVRVVSREDLEAAARLMEFMASEIATLAAANLRLQNEIEARKKIDADLQASENKFRLVVENVLDAIFVADPTGRLLMVNRQACISTGYSEEELLAMSTKDIEVGHTEEEIVEIFHDLSQGRPHRRKGRHRKKDGTLFPVEVMLCSYMVRDEMFMLAVARNMSEQEKAAQERESLIGELQLALSEIKQLSGLLPICSSCKKIRDDSGYWNQLESYIKTHSSAEFSHGICPECVASLYGKEDWFHGKGGKE
ncbi:PocR ligand-binding domain-containing protein [Desulforhopalus sp. 52FAK]